MNGLQSSSIRAHVPALVSHGARAYRGDSRWVQDLDAKIWLVECFACRKVLIERRRLYEQLIRHN